MFEVPLLHYAVCLYLSFWAAASLKDNDKIKVMVLLILIIFRDTAIFTRTHASKLVVNDTFHYISNECKYLCIHVSSRIVVHPLSVKF
jgi:hypothetical protein